MDKEVSGRALLPLLWHSVVNNQSARPEPRTQTLCSNPWTAADATEKPSLQRQSPEQAAVTDSSALRQEPTEDPPQWTTPRARHNAQTGIVTCSTLVSSVKRDGRLTPEEGSKVCDQVAAAFPLAASAGSWCGILWWGWRRRRKHIPPWRRMWFLLISLGSGRLSFFFIKAVIGEANIK